MVTLREQLRATHDDYGVRQGGRGRGPAAAASSTLTIGRGACADDLRPSISADRDDIEKLTKMSADLARVWKPTSSTRRKFRDAINDPAAAAKKFADEGLPGFNDPSTRTVTTLQAAARVPKRFRSCCKPSAKPGRARSKSAQKALHDLEQSFYGAGTAESRFAATIGRIDHGAAALAVRGADGTSTR